MEKGEGSRSSGRQEGAALNSFPQSDQEKLIRELGATAAKAASRDQLVRELGRISMK